MWLNEEKIIDSALVNYRKALLNSCPNHVVIDGLFNETKLDDVLKILHNSTNWQTQKHTYSALYVDNEQWDNTHNEERFVQRDVWLRRADNSNLVNSNSKNKNCSNSSSSSDSTVAHEFLSYLRGDEFLSVLSRIFNVTLTDMNVAEPEINTNYFRLNAEDFVEQHADDSPGREVCMLLYLNKEWKTHAGGELVFMADNKQFISVPPVYNRCVLFDPSSKGSEHWVNRLNPEHSVYTRYNVTSWYWSE